jgi:ABC-type polysaccharide/polyol phosphate transport system ATPase subunit
MMSQILLRMRSQIDFMADEVCDFAGFSQYEYSPVKFCVKSIVLNVLT